MRITMFTICLFIAAGAVNAQNRDAAAQSSRIAVPNAMAATATAESWDRPSCYVSRREAIESSMPSFDGKQYVAIASGPNILAFALPE